MRSFLLIGAILAVIIVGGVAFFGLNPPGAVSVQRSSTQSTQSTQPQATGIQAPVNIPYNCATPAVSSQYICDYLPTGYQVAPRLPNAPQPFCWSQMTPSACALFKQTFGNGVCDANETALDNPLDCGCTGLVIGDPYTGRCAAPASICQIAGAVQPQQG